MSTTYSQGIVTTRAEVPLCDLVATYLADIGVTTAFGVISIHNMPILDAIHRQQRIQFVPARTEAGAMNMADAAARISQSLGVVITSTGTAAGNAAGAQVEALTAGSPVLHITSQIDRPFMDRDRAAIHDVPRQPEMLKAVSKSYFRIWDARTAAATLAAAAEAALASPRGPVSLEIPIDVQREKTLPPIRSAAPAPAVREPDGTLLDAVAELAMRARRPILWLGGGARKAGTAATALVDRGFAVVTSANGRATVAESHPRSLGAFNMVPEADAIFRDCDLMIVVGSRLRGNETRNNDMALPRPLVQIDADAAQGGRNYPVDMFICGDARLALEGLASRLPASLPVDAAFAADIAAARARAEASLRAKLGPYATIADVLRDRVAKGRHPFVRDVTIANSTFGNRYVQFAQPHLGIHAAGGGIGQGIAMAVGAALASPCKKTVALLGDGGAVIGLPELLTAAEQKAEIVFVLMNDRGYGVIRNIQDAQYGGRRSYSDLLTLDFAGICAAIGLHHVRIAAVDAFEQAFDRALAAGGPHMIEIDMTAIGPYAEPFGGPPAGAAGRRT